ncbi:MAG: hypothetical protein IT304_01925 [Dehalococcoidia bacterium]|nr:hypothetical protein [Dehalococcoidia bacterium]
MSEPDPFLIPPELWFGLLCESVGVDENKNIQLVRVFNTFYLEEPPASTGLPPFAHFRATLAVGFSHGVGEFSATIELQDADAKTLVQRPEPWTFRVGPGDPPAAMLFDTVEHWFTEPGNYYYVVRLTPAQSEFRIRFEIARRPAGQQPAPGPA